jgi:hypothetical protein
VPPAHPLPHKHRHPHVRRFLESDGEEVARAGARQALPLAGPNGGVASVEVTVDTAELRRCKPNEEAVVTLQVYNAGASAWAEAGHVVAWEQCTVPGPERTTAPPVILAHNALQVIDSASHVEVTGPTLRVRVSKTRGAIECIDANKVSLVTTSSRGEMTGSDGLQSFWRAHTDNDNGGSDIGHWYGVFTQKYDAGWGWPAGTPRVRGAQDWVFWWLGLWRETSYGRQWQDHNLRHAAPRDVAVSVDARAGAAGGTESVAITVTYTLSAEGQHEFAVIGHPCTRVACRSVIEVRARAPREPLESPTQRRRLCVPGPDVGASASSPAPDTSKSFISLINKNIS